MTAITNLTLGPGTKGHILAELELSSSIGNLLRTNNCQTENYYV
jgi:hypothetical protein